MTDAVARLKGALEGRYRLDRELGQGGMATVYLARDVKHDRDVALKVLRPELAALLGAQRFLAEIKITARLDHPHILTLIDSGESNGLLWYVLPFVHGESLRERLNREGQLPLEDALRITRQVAGALDHAHRHGVIHRDIKPENILFHEGEAMLADFGIALAVREAGGNRLTETGLSLGTPQYMSPEQATGSRQLDERSDVYSLGAVLYEMLAGEPPVTGSTSQAIIAKLLTEKPTRLRVVRDSVPESVDAAVAKALAKTAADRFHGMQDFMNAIETHAAIETGAAEGAWAPVERASEPAAAGAASRAKRRRPRLGALLGLSVFVIAALLVSRTARVVWARARALPRLQSLVAAGDWERAYGLAARLDAIIPRDSTVAALRSVFSDTVNIAGTPAGTRVYREGYAAGPDAWEYIGTAPINRVLLPRLPSVSVFRFEADGFVTTLDIGGAASTTASAPSEVRFALTPAGLLPAGMVRVPGGRIAPDIAKLSAADSATVGDFFLGRLEVTNREYQGFVDSGGYRRRDLWEHDFVDKGRRLSWESGIARFVDLTGRPGPSTWEAGRYPRGQADNPVGGVSWYEAAAYAKFRGKRLPTVFEWWSAAKLGAAGAITSASNIQAVREGTVPVGSLASLAGYGAMDMAGNVREWCFNAAASSNNRLILGGGCSDPAYAFPEPAVASPFDRAVTNGVRLALPVAGVDTLRSGFRPVELLFRNYRVERPVPDGVFQVYRGLFAYDPAPLHSRVERRYSSQQWVVEKVSYDAAYGGERVAAYVYLPLNGRPPYQTVVFFPGGSALGMRSSQALSAGYFDFLVQGGRAVVYPIYKGTFERGDGTKYSDPDASTAYTEHAVMWEKDVSRTLDYLATRRDIDTTRFCVLGNELGRALRRRRDGNRATAQGRGIRRRRAELPAPKARGRRPKLPAPRARAGADDQRTVRLHVPSGDRGAADVQLPRNAA